MLGLCDKSIRNLSLCLIRHVHPLVAQSINLLIMYEAFKRALIRIFVHASIRPYAEHILCLLFTSDPAVKDKVNEVNKKYNTFITNDEKNVFEEDVKELIKKYDDKLTEDQNEIISLNEELLYLNQENKKLKFLTKEIIEARNETEIFFLEALNEVKRDLYKIKKEKDKRGSFFPTLKKNYETNLVKVDIRALTPEMRERVLRNLFEKINKGYDESKYRELII